jgi:hypothetical protein
LSIEFFYHHAFVEEEGKISRRKAAKAKQVEVEVEDTKEEADAMS